VKESDLYDDFDVEPLTDKELRSLQSKAYDEDIIELPKMSALKEIAAEMSTYDDD
jgi:hypothetical protein